MTRKRDQISHLVQVARIRIETTVIEIMGDDVSDEDATIEAIEIAEQLPQRFWRRQRYDRSAYRPHVQDMISREEIEELRGEGDTASMESLLDPNDDYRYLLLKADRGTAEGEVVLQPWLDIDRPDLLTSDLCREWLIPTFTGTDSRCGDSLATRSVIPSPDQPTDSEGGDAGSCGATRRLQCRWAAAAGREKP